jgi:hypothetical protein
VISFTSITATSKVMAAEFDFPAECKR